MLPRRHALVLLAALSAACQSGAAIGTTCSRDSECSSPLVCRLGRCRAECTANRDCPAGSRCLLAGGAGSCSLDVDDRCQSSGHVCPMGLTCLGDQCVNTCMSSSDCPPDATCAAAAGTSVSFCFATPQGDGGVDDAAPVDAASQLDASASDGGARDADVADAGPCAGSACDEAIDLCVGNGFACAVRGDHHVRCWGDDTRGQLGDGDDATTPHGYVPCLGGAPCAVRPTTALDTSRAPLLATRVACGESTACAVAIDGSVACWGSNDSGQAGQPGSTDLALATTVPGLASVALVHAVEIRAMRNVFCATMSDATIWCWGYDNDDVMLVGTPDAVVPPTHASGWDGRVLALGTGDICGLGSEGVVCAGNHALGELGPDYVTAPPTTSPVPITLGPCVVDVVAGEHFVCALVGGTVECWGSEEVLALGRMVTTNCAGTPCDPTPSPAMDLSSVTAVWSEGFTDMTCAANATGTWCWGGIDAGGCLLTGDTCAVPTRVPPFDGARWVAPGTESVCAIDASGGVLCFGADDGGQLGDGSSSTTPLQSAAAVPVCIRDACP